MLSSDGVIKVRQHLIYSYFLFTVTFLFCVSLSVVLISKSSHAVSAAGFNAANIIDNSVFVNSTSMSPSQIQSFLTSKVPTCDTNGTLPATEYGYPNLTHAQYAANKGWAAPPYTCLRDYSESSVGAAQIIYNVAQKYQINPQVLIVLLQKEQGLVTDTWPLAGQYQKATGYGCPDTATCDSQYYGFTNQLSWAAQLFRAVINQSSTWYSPYTLGSNIVSWNPSSSCGGSTINIQNLATAALYDYTPYQPNPAALTAGYGTGDSCSAYGNRNFYLYFTDWFGSTTGPDNAWSVKTVGLYLDIANTKPVPVRDGTYYLATGQKAYLSVAGTNIGRTTWTASTTLLGTMNPFDYASGFKNNDWLSTNRLTRSTETAVLPNGAINFAATLTAPSTTGSYNETLGLVLEGITWVTNSVIKLPITVTSPALAPVSTNNFINTATTLNKGQYILSPEGNSILKFQNDGNLVLYTNFVPVWSTNTSGTSAATFANQVDGNLVLYDSNNKPVWNSQTQTTGASILKIQGDGNLVLYTQSGNATWNSGTSKADQTNIINRSMSSGNTLFPLQSITTLDREYRLTLQSDGNLVLYDKAGNGLWSTLTFGTDKGAYLRLQGDGNLVLYNEQGKALWTARTSGTVNGVLLVQGDGNLVLYNNVNGPTWSTGTFR